MLNIPIIVAFFAGIVSFLSPCILPIIPGFLAYLGGASSENTTGGKERWEIFLNSLFFVIGFSIVFAVLGVLLNGVLAHAAYAVQTWLSWIGGVVIIFFGLYLMGFFKIGFLEYEHKLNPKITLHSRYLDLASFRFCVRGRLDAVRRSGFGRHLGARGISSPAPRSRCSFRTRSASACRSSWSALFVSQAARWINRYATVLHYVTIVFGAVLVVLGILVFTQDLSLVANFGFVNNLLLQK